MTPEQEGPPTEPKEFTRVAGCTCSLHCPVHEFGKTICSHCRKPEEGMYLECEDCHKRRAALEELAVVSRKFADWQLPDLLGYGIQPMDLTMQIRDILRRLDGPLRRDLELDALTPAPGENGGD